MSRKLCYILITLWAFGLPAMSEEKPKDDPPSVKLLAKGNWYIEIGGGVQTLFSKDANKLAFGKRVTPSVSFTGGKWFSPYWGARLQLQGFSYHGFSTTDGVYLGDPLNNNFIYGLNDPVRNHVSIRPDGSYRHYLRYMNLHADFQVALLNLIVGEDEQRKWEVIPAVGLGYMHLFPYKGTPKNNVLSANFSLMGKYRLTKDFDINLEVQTAVMPDQFDGRIAGKLYENSCAVTLGVTYHFKKRGFSKKTVDYVPKEVIRTVRDTVTVTKEIKVEVEKEVFNQPFTLAVIRFGIDSYTPRQEQDINYVNVVRYLNANPRAKIRLDGYADQQTGIPDYNLKLSIKRAATVRQILIDKYGIDKDRVQAQGIGSNGQPYEKNNWNRVVVVTAIEQ